MEEKNRSLRLNGHAWNWGDGPVPCTVRGRDFGLEEAERAILKEIERQHSRGALRPTKSKPLALGLRGIGRRLVFTDSFASG